MVFVEYDSEWSISRIQLLLMNVKIGFQSNDPKRPNIRSNTRPKLEN